MATELEPKPSTRKIGDLVITYDKSRPKEYDDNGQYVDTIVHHISDTDFVTCYPQGRYRPAGIKIKIQATPSRVRRVIDITQIPADGVKAHIFRCPLPECKNTENRRDRVRHHVEKAHKGSLPRGMKWSDHPTCSWHPRALLGSGDGEALANEEVGDKEDELTTFPAVSTKTTAQKSRNMNQTAQSKTMKNILPAQHKEKDNVAPEGDSTNSAPNRPLIAQAQRTDTADGILTNNPGNLQSQDDERASLTETNPFPYDSRNKQQSDPIKNSAASSLKPIQLSPSNVMNFQFSKMNDDLRSVDANNQAPIAPMSVSRPNHQIPVEMLAGRPAHATVTINDQGNQSFSGGSAQDPRSNAMPVAEAPPVSSNTSNHPGNTTVPVDPQLSQFKFQPQHADSQSRSKPPHLNLDLSNDRSVPAGPPSEAVSSQYSYSFLNDDFPIPDSVLSHLPVSPGASPINNTNSHPDPPTNPIQHIPSSVFESVALIGASEAAARDGDAWFDPATMSVEYYYKQKRVRGRIEENQRYEVSMEEEARAGRREHPHPAEVWRNWDEL